MDLSAIDLAIMAACLYAQHREQSVVVCTAQETSVCRASRVHNYPYHSLALLTHQLSSSQFA